MLDIWQTRVNLWRRLRARDHAERLERQIDRRLGLLPTRTCRREARSTYVGAGTVLCWVQGRYYLFASGRDTNITPPLANSGRISPWLSRVMAHAVKPDMIVADVGANIGYFTMQLADHVGPRGRVCAFEPNADLAALVRRSAEANQYSERVVVYSVPLGDEDGLEMWLCVPGEALAGAAVHDREWVAIWNAQLDTDRQGLVLPERDVRKVALRRLDSMQEASTIGFAKIDVEGFEPQVWAGMAGLLSGDNLQTIVLEYTPGHYADADAFAAQFYQLGWRVSLIDEHSGPSPISRDALSTLNRSRGYDLLLTR